MCIENCQCTTIKNPLKYIGSQRRAHIQENKEPVLESIHIAFLGKGEDCKEYRERDITKVERKQETYEMRERYNKNSSTVET